MDQQKQSVSYDTIFRAVAVVTRTVGSMVAIEHGLYSRRLRRRVRNRRESWDARLQRFKSTIGGAPVDAQLRDRELAEIVAQIGRACSDGVPSRWRDEKLMELFSRLDRRASGSLKTLGPLDAKGGVLREPRAVAAEWGLVPAACNLDDRARSLDGQGPKTQ